MNLKIYLKNYNIVWLLYSIGLLLLYFPARNMCVFDDMVNFYAVVEKIGWTGFQNSYGFSSNYFTHNILMVTLYKLFGNHQIYYYIIGCLWHAANATLLLKLLRHWTIHLESFISQYLPICTSILWLCSSMQSENIVYMGTLQYQYVCTLLLSLLLYFHNWIGGNVSSKIEFIFIYLFYISGLFAQEISIFFPVILVIVMCYYIALQINYRTWFAFCMQWFLPMIGAVVCYFYLHYFTFQNWLPHYGDMHLQGINLPNITTHFSNNFFKNIMMAHYGSAAYTKVFYAISKQEGTMLFLWILLLSSCIFICFYRQKKTGIFMVFLISLFAILYGPSANFGNYSLENIINDRLLFFPRLFLFGILILFIISIHKQLRIIVYCFIITQIALIWPTVQQYKIAGNMMRTMQQTFTYTSQQKILFLNLPYQYKGITICRYPYSIASNIMVYNHIDLQDNYMSIARKTKWTTAEDITISTINDSTILVQNNINDEWFECNGVIEKPQFKNVFTFQQLPYNSYQISISKSATNYRLLYLAKDGFHDYILGKDSLQHICYR